MIDEFLCIYIYIHTLTCHQGPITCHRGPTTCHYWKWCSMCCSDPPFHMHPGPLWPFTNSFKLGHPFVSVSCAFGNAWHTLTYITIPIQHTLAGHNRNKQAQAHALRGHAYILDSRLLLLFMAEFDLRVCGEFIDVEAPALCDPPKQRSASAPPCKGRHGVRSKP